MIHLFRLIFGSKRAKSIHKSSSFFGKWPKKKRVPRICPQSAIRKCHTPGYANNRDRSDHRGDRGGGVYQPIQEEEVVLFDGNAFQQQQQRNHLKKYKFFGVPYGVFTIPVDPQIS